jgi:glycosyltransferase involved in cell wall biosynthesis
MIKTELSFIIPALNEEMHIGGVLDTIRDNVGTRFPYDVIVVDNGSSDRTVEIAGNKGAICLLAPGCTISTLRNLGAAEARSEILVFLDADVYLGNDWGGRIRSVMERLSHHPNIITGSLYGVSEENNWIERVWFAPRTTLKEINYINGGHLILLRSLFLKVGGFDPESETGEDYEFCSRARGMGARIENDPELHVVHAGYPKNIKRFFARERWHGRGDYKSVGTLVSSKPALVCLANIGLAVICAVCISVGLQPWPAYVSIYLFFLAGVSLAASVRRSRSEFTPDFWRIIVLYMIYFTARSLSLVDVVMLNLSKKRRVSASVSS